MENENKQCNGLHCRCMEKDCPNTHHADCVEHNPSLKTENAKSGTRPKYSENELQYKLLAGKQENERLRKRIEKDELFVDMLKDLITEYLGIKEFSKDQTVYGCINRGLLRLVELEKENAKLKLERSQD